MVAGGGASVIYADTVGFLFIRQKGQDHASSYSVAFFSFWNSLLKILLDQVGDLGYAAELGNYAEYSGAPNEEEVLQYARVVIDVRGFLCIMPMHNHSRGDT